MFCPSCGEFISADDPETCPFCGFAVKRSSLMASGQVSDVSALEFKRSNGLSDGGPRRFIDKRLPRCPFCRSPEPQWEYAEVKGWLNRANFRCQKCLGVLSVPLGAMITWRSPTSLLGSLGASEYLRVEKVGDSPGIEAVASRLVGGEFPLDKLRTWADRPPEELPGSAG